MTDAFTSSLYVPNMNTLTAVDNVLGALGTFTDVERRRVQTALTDAGLGSKIAVGVKKMIYMAEMASQDDDKVETLVQAITEDGVALSRS